MKNRGFISLRRAILSLLLIVCLCTGLIRGFPELPVSQPTDVYIEQAEQILPYLRDCLPSILYAIFALIISVLAFYTGALFKRRTKDSKRLGEACELLGAFVLLSGIWMLTDSRALCFFESPQDAYGAVFASFISFMLMPIAFLGCISRLLSDRLLKVSSLLMTVNLAVFMAMTLLRLDERAYLTSLAFHHAVMVVFIVYLIVKALRHVLASRKPADSGDDLLADIHSSRAMTGGVVAFLVLMLAAFVLFWMGGQTMYAAVLALGMAVLIGTLGMVVLNETFKAREKQIQAEIYERLAFTDALSGIENRNAFLRDQRLYGDEAHLGYVVLDINGLKQINDLSGHTAGDVVIQAAARAISGSFAHIGTCYRIGGDEFAVMVLHAREHALERAAAHLEECVAKGNRSGCPELSIACGWAVRGTPGESAGQIFARADTIMYACKRKMKGEMTTPDAEKAR